MWWWHWQHFQTQHVDTVNILGSGSIRYVMEVYRICCLVFSIYFLAFSGNPMGHMRKRVYKVKVSKFVRLRRPNASDRPFGAVCLVILLMTELFRANWIIYCPSSPCYA